MLILFVCACVCGEGYVCCAKIILLSCSLHCIRHDRLLKRTLSHWCNADSLQCLLANPRKSPVSFKHVTQTHLSVCFCHFIQMCWIRGIIETHLKIQKHPRMLDIDLNKHISSVHRNLKGVVAYYYNGYICPYNSFISQALKNHQYLTSCLLSTVNTMLKT